MLTLAMLPLGLIAVYQTRVVVEDARTMSSAALMARTIAAASEERELIKNTLGIAEGLASVMPEISQLRCVDILDALVSDHRLILSAAYVDENGEPICRSSFEVADFSISRSFSEVLDREDPFVSLVPAKNLPGRYVTVATQPIFQSGTVTGYILLSISHAQANFAMQVPEEEEGLQLISINLDGDLVTASTPLDVARQFLPLGRTVDSLPQFIGRTFRDVSRSGEDRFYAIVPMIDDALYLVGSWPLGMLPEEQSRFQATVAVLFPILMWIVGIGVAMFGMRQLVVNHIAELRSAMRRFALGERDVVPLTLSSPPSEIEEAQRAFNRMALLINDAEKRREQDLQEKEVLLREVHHRVKNNLQHIASLINLQARKVRSQDIQNFLATLNRRVRGLGVLHRYMYNTPNAATVSAAELIEAVLTDLRDAYGTAKLPKITTDLEPVELLPDQAVPLSLLMSELVTEVLGADGSGVGEAGIHVALRAVDEDTVSLLVDAPDAQVEVEDTAIGGQLIRAFTRQLGGTDETLRGDTGYRVRIEFKRQS